MTPCTGKLRNAQEDAMAATTSSHGLGRVRALAAMMVLATACAEPPVDPGEEPNPDSAQVASYIQDLPAWAAFAPPQADIPPTPTGSATALPPEVVDLRQVEDDSSVTVIPDVTYQCTTTPYTVRDTPTQIVMYSPDTEILWPGALIQGKSHRDGLGALLGLVIAERTPIQVSIPGFATGDNFREVASPSQATVSSAVGSIIGNATASGLSAPSTITFTQESYHSEKDFALSVGISGHYLGFSGSATGDFSRNASETTISAQFYQKMFEVVVAPPQTPGAFFSNDFTQAKLDQQIALGRLGPDNIPVYVSNVVYGRMMMFSFTSTAKEDEIRGTLSAAYNSLAGGAQFNLSAKQKRILQEAKIAVTSLGGDADATLALIRSGDWSQYFTNNAPLSSAAPLSYTLRNLSDGSIASVAEATDYNIKQCQAVPASPGTFQFRPIQTTTPPVPAGVRTRLGDVNDDGRTDVIWNHLGTTNEVYVGLAVGDGTFSFTPAAVHPETPAEGWANYTPLVADVNGDGQTDVLWNHLGTENKTYVGLGNGDGTFGYPTVRVHPNMSWAPYRAYTGDFTGDSWDDLLWNSLSSTENRTYLGLSLGNSQFRFPTYEDRGLTGWATYVALVGNVDGDADADLLWNTVSGTNRTYLARSDGDSTWTFSAAMDNARYGSWAGFVALVGDVDGDLDADIVWADTATAETRVAVGRSLGTSLEFLTPDSATYDAGVPLRIRLGDVDGDGDADLMWNTTGAVNRTFVSLGKSDATFDFSPVSQLHPATEAWDQFTMYVGDVNGDGRADVIWNHHAATNRIYVALAKP
jgi:hypothetical protein